MRNFKHSIITKARLETIWELYADITAWTSWDIGIEYASLEGPFAAGTSGVLQPQGQDKLSFQLIDVEPLDGFSDVTDIPGADITIRFDHRLQKTLDGTRITHSVSITGPNVDKFGEQFIAELSDGIPQTMERLAALAIEKDESYIG